MAHVQVHPGCPAGCQTRKENGILGSIVQFGNGIRGALVNLGIEIRNQLANGMNHHARRQHHGHAKNRYGEVRIILEPSFQGELTVGFGTHDRYQVV